MTEFRDFGKIARLSRDVIITEKLDGTNASIYIGVDHYLDLEFRVGSRTRWITPSDDNYGFAKWAYEHKEELVEGLGQGHHFGEWWGRGIQRNYSKTEKTFSLFNTTRWGETRPACCSVVPVLYAGPFEEDGVMKGVKESLKRLQEQGSVAAPGFMKPEGIVVFHETSGQLFKKTLEKDDKPKGMS